MRLLGHESFLSTWGWQTFGLSVLYCTEYRVGVLQNPDIGKLNNKVTEISATAILLYSCTPVCTGIRLLLHAGRPIRWTGTNPNTSTNGPVCWDCLHSAPVSATSVLYSVLQ